MPTCQKSGVLGADLRGARTAILPNYSCALQYFLAAESSFGPWRRLTHENHAINPSRLSTNIRTARDTRAMPQSIALVDIAINHIHWRHGQRSVSPRFETQFVDLQARNLRVQSLTGDPQLRGSAGRP